MRKPSQPGQEVRYFQALTQGNVLSDLITFKLTVCGFERLVAKDFAMYEIREIKNENTEKYYYELPISEYGEWFEIDYSAEGASKNCGMDSFGLFKDEEGTIPWGQTPEEQRLAVIDPETESVIVYFQDEHAGTELYLVGFSTGE